MFGIGLPEMILIMALALIVVGPDKLPELARSIAKGIMELKKTAEGLKDSLAESGNPLDDIKPDLEDAANHLKRDLLDLPPYERKGQESRSSHQAFNKTAENAAEAYQELMKHTGVNSVPPPDETVDTNNPALPTTQTDKNITNKPASEDTDNTTSDPQNPNEKSGQ